MKNTIMKHTSTDLGGMAACLVYTMFARKTERDTESYGISIKNELTGESAVVHNITEDIAVSEKLFERLLTGVVTPVCLKDVVEDFIVEN